MTQRRRRRERALRWRSASVEALANAFDRSVIVEPENGDIDGIVLFDTLKNRANAFGGECAIPPQADEGLACLLRRVLVFGDRHQPNTGHAA